MVGAVPPTGLVVLPIFSVQLGAAIAKGLFDSLGPGGTVFLRIAFAALAGLAVALLSSVVPYSLELEALRRLPARVFGVLMSLEPAVAALVGFLVLGEQLGPRALSAMALVTLAAAGASRFAGSR